jgi:hypothetical protein
MPNPPAGSNSSGEVGCAVPSGITPSRDGPVQLYTRFAGADWAMNFVAELSRKTL